MARNWEKTVIEDSSDRLEIEWFNRRTTEKIILEGEKNEEYYVYTTYSHPAVGGIDLGSFWNQSDAMEKVQDYKENNEGPTGDIPATSTVVKDMLTESTAPHPKDAWGTRHEEMNRDRNFEAEDKVTVDVTRNDNVIVYASLYHFLVNHLEYDEEAERMSNLLNIIKEQNDTYWAGAINIMMGSSENTANHENVLDQGMIYGLARLDSEGEIISEDINEANYVAVSVHQGADTRGGYTDTRVFKLDAYDPASFLTRMRDVSARTEGGEHSWYSDDAGYHWYAADSDTEDGTENWDFRPEEDRVIYEPTGEEINFFVSW